MAKRKYSNFIDDSSDGSDHECSSINEGYNSEIEGEDLRTEPQKITPFPPFASGKRTAYPEYHDNTESELRAITSDLEIVKFFTEKEESHSPDGRATSTLKMLGVEKALEVIPEQQKETALPSLFRPAPSKPRVNTVTPSPATIVRGNTPATAIERTPQLLPPISRYQLGHSS